MSQVDDTSDTQGPDQRSATPQRGSPRVTAHQSDEDWTVFTESGNSDGWIATDATVCTTR